MENKNENIINNETTGNPNAVKVARTQKLYAIFDRKKMAFLQIMEKGNNALALRDFDVIANAEQGMVKRYPDDFALYKLGEMDEETGELISNKTLIAEAREVVKDVRED